MLTGYQLQTVGYYREGVVYCVDCFSSPQSPDCDASFDEEEYEREHALCRYSAEESAGYEGLVCDTCGATIVEPTPCDKCEDGIAQDSIRFPNGIWYDVCKDCAALADEGNEIPEDVDEEISLGTGGEE